MPHFAVVVVVEAPDVDLAYDTVTDQLCPEASEHLAEYVSEPWSVQPTFTMTWSAEDVIAQH